MAGHPGRRHDEKDDDKQNVRAIKDDCMFSFNTLPIPMMMEMVERSTKTVNIRSMIQDK